jgi:hypothetical protein
MWDDLPVMPPYSPVLPDVEPEYGLDAKDTMWDE